MAIKKAIFKIFNGSTWDEYHYKTDTAQIVHTDMKGNEETVEFILNGTDWVPVTLQNGSKTPNVAETKLSVKRHGDIVYLRGNLTVNATKAGTTVCSIPVGFRPVAHLRFLAGRYDVRFGTIGVSADGTMALIHDTNITEASKTYYINTCWSTL